MPSQKQIVNRLRRMASDARALAESAETLLAEVQGNGDTAPAIGVCAWCGDPIRAGQRTARGIHFSPCYQFARAKVNGGEATWEELIAAGKVAAPKKLGRPAMSIEEHRRRESEEQLGEDIAAEAKAEYKRNRGKK